MREPVRESPFVFMVLPGPCPVPEVFAPVLLVVPIPVPVAPDKFPAPAPVDPAAPPPIPEPPPPLPPPAPPPPPAAKEVAAIVKLARTKVVFNNFILKSPFLVSPEWDWQKCKQPVKRGVVMPNTDSRSGPGIDCPARLLLLPEFLTGNRKGEAV